jgi:hypothetical protein
MIHVIQAMKRQESTAYRTSPYLQNVVVTEKDRHDLCQWGFDIMDACQECQVDRRIATVAISYFDRFLSCRDLRSVEICLAGRREFQLAFIVSTGTGHIRRSTPWGRHCMCRVSHLEDLSRPHCHCLHLYSTQTCLVIAIKACKYMEVTPAFVAETMCDNRYHPKELIDMEVEILGTLSWRLNGPTPQDFIQHFVELLPPCTNEKVVNMISKEACKNAEMAMMNYSMAMKPYSCIALASITATVQNQGPQMGCDFITVNQWMSAVRWICSV